MPKSVRAALQWSFVGFGWEAGCALLLFAALWLPCPFAAFPAAGTGFAADWPF